MAEKTSALKKREVSQTTSHKWLASRPSMPLLPCESKYPQRTRLSLHDCFKTISSHPKKYPSVEETLERIGYSYFIRMQQRYIDQDLENASFNNGRTSKISEIVLRLQNKIARQSLEKHLKTNTVQWTAHDPKSATIYERKNCVWFVCWSVLTTLEKHMDGSERLP